LLKVIAVAACPRPAKGDIGVLDTGAGFDPLRKPAAKCCALQDFLFDHLVGAYQQPGRKFNPERLRGFEVEGQLYSCGLLDR
jgi:hypothetical protein